MTVIPGKLIITVNLKMNKSITLPALSVSFNSFGIFKKAQVEVEGGEWGIGSVLLLW